MPRIAVYIRQLFSSKPPKIKFANAVRILQFFLCVTPDGDYNDYPLLSILFGNFIYIIYVMKQLYKFSVIET